MQESRTQDACKTHADCTHDARTMQESCTHDARSVHADCTTNSCTEEKRGEERRGEGEPARANAFTVYQELIGGTFGQVIADTVNAEIDACDKHRLALTACSPGSDIDGDAWVAQAIIEAHGAGKPYWNYAKKIVNRWREEGYKSEFVYHGPGEKIVPKHTEVFQ